MNWDAATREARPDHLLSRSKTSTTHDESVQGRRGGRRLQPHRAVRLGRSRSASSKDYMDKPEVAIEYYAFNTTQAADERPPRAQGVQPGGGQGGAGRIPPSRQAADVVHTRRHLPEAIPRPDGRRLRSGSARGSCWPKPDITDADGQVRSVDVPGRAAWRSSTTPRRPTSRSPSSCRRSGSRISGLTVPLKNMELKTFLDVARQAAVQRLLATGLDRRLHGSRTRSSICSRRLAERTAPAGGIQKYVAHARGRQPQPDPQKRYRAPRKSRSVHARRAAGIPLYTADRLAEETLRQRACTRTR